MTAETVQRLASHAEQALRRGDHDEALGALVEATRHAPAHAGLWNNIALVLLDAKRHAHAVIAAERALALDATHAFAWSNLGEAL